MAATGQVLLVLGGTRSGKSALAERLVLAAASAPDVEVTYVATGPPVDRWDAEWRARVAEHRKRRPPSWATVELPSGDDLVPLLEALGGAVLVDSLGTWVAGFGAFAAPIDQVVAALRARSLRGLLTVVVSEEVGMAVHAPTEAGRRFADALGELNQAVAAAASRVLLAVAGRAVELADPAAAGVDSGGTPRRGVP